MTQSSVIGLGLTAKCRKRLLPYLNFEPNQGLS